MHEDRKQLVLLIDDELEADSSLVRSLVAAGLTVELVNKASSLRPTLDRLQARPLAAIVLDLMMPPDGLASLEETGGGRFTGVLALPEIQHRFPNTPIVVLSAHSEDDVRHLLPGIAAFVEKPTTAARLVELLRRRVGTT